MKSILISIKPKWVAKILNGEKTIEIRKTMPKCDLPIDVYIYCTKGKQNYMFANARYTRKIGKHECIITEDVKANGMVLAKFTLNKVEEIKKGINLGTYYTDTLVAPELLEKASCLKCYQIYDYLFTICVGVHKGYAWHISNLVIFDRPKELSEFSVRCPKADVKFDGVKGKMLAYKPLTKAPQSFCFIEVEE